jgi:hypothetical protein
MTAFRSPLMAAILTAAMFAADPPKPTIAQQVLELPSDSVVELCLNSSKRKLRGRLGKLAAEDLEVHVADSSAITKQSLRSADVASVKAETKSSPGRSGAFVAQDALAGIGVVTGD